jgi:hypothetical protein
MTGFSGEIKCAEDNENCILDGENIRIVMWLWGGSYTLRSLTLQKGYTPYGGAGLEVFRDTSVDIIFCQFLNNKAAHGAGILINTNDRVNINIYGTIFVGNTGNSQHSDDIDRRGGTITIHDTCPSPLFSTPIKGKRLVKCESHNPYLHIPLHFPHYFSQGKLCPHLDQFSAPPTRTIAPAALMATVALLLIAQQTPVKPLQTPQMSEQFQLVETCTA